MTQLKLKKCSECGALVRVTHDCTCEDCGITCCGKTMKEVKANSTDASFEKHIPTYEVNKDNMTIKVNHVMDNDHYIEWILVQTKKSKIELTLEPNDNPTLTVPYEKGAMIYSYCNKHGLWKTEIK